MKSSMKHQTVLVKNIVKRQQKKKKLSQRRRARLSSSKVMVVKERLSNKIGLTNISFVTSQIIFFY